MSLFVAYEDLVEGAPGREGAWARVDAFLGAAPRPAPGAGGLRIIHTGPILEAVGNAGEVYETMRWACGPDLDLGGACAEVLGGAGCACADGPCPCAAGPLALARDAEARLSEARCRAAAPRPRRGGARSRQ